MIIESRGYSTVCSYSRSTRQRGLLLLYMVYCLLRARRYIYVVLPVVLTTGTAVRLRVLEYSCIVYTVLSALSSDLSNHGVGDADG